MDFRFLYEPDRRIFHIGYNLEAAMLDRNFYDLLASEARIASLIAIAKGEVNQEHWVYLNRPVTEVDGRRVLLSWSATMFEYLMPPLFLRSYKGTLLDESARGAVQHQMTYAREKGVPWGISEAGFYRFDNNQSYQYRAFGVPGLGFKRGLGDDLVIAPYASLMAMPIFPHEVMANIQKMIALKMLGLYGFFESTDFTSERMPLDRKYQIVYEYMAHHQGMILLALANSLCDNIMIQRMHSNPAIRSVELLLQEQVPFDVPDQGPEAGEVKGIQRRVTPPVELFPWPVPVQTPVPQAHLLSNGSYSVLIDNAGSGYSRWHDIDLTRWQPDSVTSGGGTWIYLQELAPQARGAAQKNGSAQDSQGGSSGGKVWSADFQPIPGNSEKFLVTFHPHMVVFRRDEDGLVSTLEVCVAAEDPLEIRR
ncbi:MAG: hypothetical protein IH586_13220, partial [Anaerolineaceae bacterium]|nr:hypothetical protein [Anaerolineaceae bacterium]